MDKERRILKSAGAVGFFTAVSRVFGYVRDAVLAAVLGAGMSMDAFAVAFRLANLFRRLVAEGAMSAAFIPVFIQYRKERTEAELWDFARKFFYVLAVAAGTLVVLEIALAPLIVRMMAPGFSGTEGKFHLTVFLTRLMAPYLLFVALAAFLMGILNSLGSFALPAISPIFFNLAVIVSALVFASLSPEPVVAIAIGVLVGGALQFACQLPLVIRRGMSFRVGFSLAHPAIQKVGLLLAPTTFGIGIVQINLLVDSLMASLLREGSVSQIYYADRVMELMLGIFVVSLTTVTLPQMAEAVAEKKIEELRETVLFSLRTISFVAIPATVGLFLLADPIVHVLFERGRFSSLDTERTAVALAYYALGLSFLSATKLLVSAFYALQDTKTPVRIAFVSLFLNAALNWILMHPLKQGGIALATSLASAFSLVQLLVHFQKRHGPLNWQKMRQGLAKIAVAASVMGVSCLLILQVFQFEAAQPLGWKLVGLFGTIGCGILIYLGTAFILRMEELQFLTKIRR